MFGLLKAKEKLDKEYSEPFVLPAMPLPIIGEPVLSIAEAMKDASNWTVKRTHYYDRMYTIKVRHIIYDECLSFVERTSCTYKRDAVDVLIYKTDYSCSMEWMTKPEQEFIAKQLKVFLEAHAILADQYRAMEHQIERDKFMVFVKEKQ